MMIKIVSCVRCDNDTDTDTRSPAGPRKQTPTPDTISDTRPGEAGTAFLGLPSFQHKTRNMQCLNHQFDKNNANYDLLHFKIVLMKKSPYSILIFQDEKSVMTIVML